MGDHAIRPGCESPPAPSYVGSREDMESVLELLETLGDLLVMEFRTCQRLYNLIEKEYMAHAEGAAEALVPAANHKEALLEELEALEEQICVCVHGLGSLLVPNHKITSLADVLAALPADIGGRLSRIRAGSSILMDCIRDLIQGKSSPGTADDRICQLASYNSRGAQCKTHTG